MAGDIETPKFHGKTEAEMANPSELTTLMKLNMYRDLGLQCEELATKADKAPTDRDLQTSAKSMAKEYERILGFPYSQRIERLREIESRLGRIPSNDRLR